MARAISHREKNIIIAGGIFLVCFLSYWFVIVPKREELKSLKDRVLRMTKEYEQIGSIEKQYNRLTSETESVKQRIGRRGTDFDLSAFVAEKEKQQNFTRTTQSPPHSEAYGDFEKQTSTFSYQNKSLDQIVEFLKQVEKPENVVSIEWLAFKPKPTDPSQLSLDIRLATVAERKEGSK